MKGRCACFHHHENGDKKSRKSGFRQRFRYGVKMGVCGLLGENRATTGGSPLRDAVMRWFFIIPFISKILLYHGSRQGGHA